MCIRDRKRTGRRWLTAVIQKLWDTAWDLWDDRNRIVHDKDQGIILAKLHVDIRHQIALGRQTLTRDTRGLFDQARQRTFFTRVTAYKQAWLLRVEAARARALRRRARDQDSEAYLRNGLRNFLSHGSTNPLPQSYQTGSAI